MDAHVVEDIVAFLYPNAADEFAGMTFENADGSGDKANGMLMLAASRLRSEAAPQIRAFDVMEDRVKPSSPEFRGDVWIEPPLQVKPVLGDGREILLWNSHASDDDDRLLVWLIARQRLRASRLVNVAKLHVPPNNQGRTCGLGGRAAFSGPPKRRSSADAMCVTGMVAPLRFLD